MTQSKDPTAANALKKFEATIVVKDTPLILDDVRGYARARPGVMLPVGKPILLPEFFHGRHGRFEMWSVETLDERGALAWSFWMSATWFAYHNEPALLPYLAQLRPTTGWRLGGVFRPGIVTI